MRAKRLEMVDEAKPRLGARVPGAAQDFFPPAAVDRNSSSGPGEIHLARRPVADAFDVGSLRVALCGGLLPGRRIITAAHHDDPRFCAECLKKRDVSRVVTVLVFRS
jgi:hypothetical protein